MAVLGCGACHPGAPAPDAARAVSPDLAGLSVRWDADVLAAYLEEPTPSGAGVSRMPDFHLTPAEAAAVTLHLLRDDRSRAGRARLVDLARRHPDATAERGAAIVEVLNCAGCHEGVGVGWAPGPPLAGLDERVRPDWLVGYIGRPRAVRPIGYHPGSFARMPDFGLSPAEVDTLVSWLAGPQDSTPAAEASEPLSAFEDAKAASLLGDHLPCLGCHSLDGDGGRIGPTLDGVGGRLRPEYLARVVRDPAAVTPMTVMPRPLEDSATLELIVRHLENRTGAPTGDYLSLLGPMPRRPQRSAAAGDSDGGGSGAGRQPRDPAALYARYCAACHGPEGRGDGFNAVHLPRPPTAHADPGVMSGRPDATLYDGIHGGGHILGRSHRMPGFGATLSRADIVSLVSHLRVLCDCEQPVWAAP